MFNSKLRWGESPSPGGGCRQARSTQPLPACWVPEEEGDGHLRLPMLPVLLARTRGERGWEGGGGELSCAVEGGNKARALSRGNKPPSPSPGALAEPRSLGFSPISRASGWAAALAAKAPLAESEPQVCK